MEQLEVTQKFANALKQVFTELSLPIDEISIDGDDVVNYTDNDYVWISHNGRTFTEYYVGTMCYEPAQAIKAVVCEYVKLNAICNNAVIKECLPYLP